MRVITITLILGCFLTFLACSSEGNDLSDRPDGVNGSFDGANTDQGNFTGQKRMTGTMSKFGSTGSIFAFDNDGNSYWGNAIISGNNASIHLYDYDGNSYWGNATISGSYCHSYLHNMDGTSCWSSIYVSGDDIGTSTTNTITPPITNNYGSTNSGTTNMIPHYPLTNNYGNMNTGTTNIIPQYPLNTNTMDMMPPPPLPNSNDRKRSSTTDWPDY